MEKLIELNSRKFMNLVKVSNLFEIETTIAKFYRKDGNNNNYLMTAEYRNLIEHHRLFYGVTDNNLFILVKKDKCYRVYYYLNSVDEPFDLGNEDFAVEILYRGGGNFPKVEVDFWIKCGFKLHLVRDMYECRYKNINQSMFDVPKFEIYPVSNSQDLNYVVNLFNAKFDNYTGDYISESEMPQLLAARNIFIAYVGGKKAGAIHFYERNKAIFLGHLFVNEEFRGMHIGTQLFHRGMEVNKVDENTRYSLWVQKQNNSAVRLYEKIGFKYINKSTISLLKLKENS